MPMPAEVISQVHRLARRAKAKNTLTFTNTRDEDLGVLYTAIGQDEDDVYPTNEHEDLEEKCKEILMMINQCKFILDRNSLPLEKLGESDFKNMANEHKTNEKIAIFSKIRKIRNITSDLEKQISMFQSGEMEEYRYLEEMLSSNIFALDSIDTTNLALTQPEGALDMRQKRKEVINWNQKLLDDLDSKLDKTNLKDGLKETNKIILNEVKVIENRKTSICDDVRQSDCNQFETNGAECSSILNMVL